MADKPERSMQIELMINAKERIAENLRRWIAKPEFKEALHRRDHEDDGDGHQNRVRRVAGR